MNTEILQSIKKQSLPILKAANVRRAALFGSYVRGDNTKDSDIDMLVDLPEHASLFELIGLKLDLEDKLKKKVDVIEYDGIYPPLRSSILSNQFPLL